VGVYRPELFGVYLALLSASDVCRLLSASDSVCEPVYLHCM